MSRDAAIAAFLSAQGWDPALLRPLAGDASFRKYHRLSRGAEKVVLMDAPPPQEDIRPFIKIGRQLEALGYSAPHIMAADEAQGLMLLEDLGDETYTRLLAKGEDEAALYELAIDVLADLHRRGAVAIPDALPPYDEARLLTEASLLTDWYMPAVGLSLTEYARQDYLNRWRTVLPLARRVPDTMVLRDFHVDNLMRLPRPGLAACGLLDFQDAVAGPLTYDPMSLLEDARRDIDPALVAKLRARYLAAMPGLDPAGFDASWAVLAAQRHAKVIGIFTRLCKRDGKPIYLGHIPRVWRLLEGALAHPALGSMKAWLDQFIPPERRTVPQP